MGGVCCSHYYCTVVVMTTVVVITIVAQIFSVLQATHVRTLQSAETGAQGSNARTALWDIQAIL